MKSVGIDIGSSSIKIAEVELRSGELTLIDFLKIDLPLDQDADLAKLEGLRCLANHYDPRSTRFVIGIPTNKVCSRQVALPFKERHKLLKSLPFELEDDIPFDSGNSVMDAKIINYRGNLSQLLAFACPNSTIENTINLAHEAGIDPDILSVSGATLTNTFEVWQLPPQEFISPEVSSVHENLDTVIFQINTERSAQIILDIGHQHTSLAVFHSGSLLATRAISFGGNNIIHSIMDQYKLSYDEAAKALREKGSLLLHDENVSQEQLTFSKLISDSIDELAQQVKITLLELRSHFHVQFEDIHITGGVSSLTNICDYLTKELELPVSPLEFLTKISKIFPGVTKDLQKQGCAAIGLAIEGLRRPRNPAINFRRGEFGKESQTFKFLWEKWHKAIQLGTASIFIFYIYAFFGSSLSVKLSDLATDNLKQQAKKEPFQLTGSRATTSGVRKYVQRQKKVIKDKKRLAELENLSSALDVINSITTTFPTKERITTDVRRLLVANENVTIEGEVAKLSDRALIENALKKIAVRQKITPLRESIQVSPGRIAFAYNFKINRRKGH